MWRKIVAGLALFAVLTGAADAAGRVRAAQRLLLLENASSNFPTPGAIIDENFVTSQFFPGPIASDIVDTRASVAFLTNAAGVISSVTNNVLRTSTAGMVIEPAGVYGLWPSVPTTATNWSVFAATISYNNAVAPDGTTTAAQVLTSGTGTGEVFMNGTVGGTSTIVANNPATYFAFVKAGTRNAGNIYLATNSNANGCKATWSIATGLIGTLTPLGNGTCVSAAMSQLGTSGWWVISVSGTLSTSNAVPSPGVELLAGTASQGVLVWGAGVVLGAAPPALPPSYFATTSAAATRAADAAVIQHTGIGQCKYTFDDGSTQTIFTNPSVNPPIPTNLNRSTITRLTCFATTAPLRQAVSTTTLPDGNNGSAAQVGTQQFVTFRQRCDSVQAILPNFYSVNGAETNTGGTLTGTAALQLNGVVYPFTFSGSASGATAGNLLITDELALPVGARSGDAANFLAHGASSNSILGTSDSFPQPNGGKTQFGASVPDPTTGGTITNTATGVSWGAVAITCRHNGRAIALLGDSIEYGFNSGGGIAPNGLMVPSLSPTLPVFNMAVPGNSMTSFLVTHTTQIQLAQYFTSFGNQLGINDLLVGDTAAQLTTMRASIAALLPGPVVPTTITPSSNSSDGWTTAVGQGTLSYNPARQTFNTSIRALSTFIDIAQPLEDVQGSGIWKNPGDATAPAALTADGIHPNPTGGGIVTVSGVVNPALFQ